MSTRCQVEISQSGLPWDGEPILLYHHTDGYPSYMLPIIRKAFRLATKPKKWGNESWRAGRAAKVASYLCAADPGVFEPEANATLHGDIRYFYALTAKNSAGGSLAENPTWDVQIFKPTWTAFEDADKSKLHPLTEPMSIEVAARKAKRIEKMCS